MHTRVATVPAHHHTPPAPGPVSLSKFSASSDPMLSARMLLLYVVVTLSALAFPPGCSSFGCDPFRSAVIHGVMLERGGYLQTPRLQSLDSIQPGKLGDLATVRFNPTGVGCIGSGVAATCLAGNKLVQLNSSGTIYWQWSEQGDGKSVSMPGTKFARTLPVAGYQGKIETASENQVCYIQDNGTTQWSYNVLPSLSFGIVSAPVTNNRSLNFYTRSDGYSFGYDDRSTPVAQIPTRVCGSASCSTSDPVASVGAPTVAGQRVVFVGGVFKDIQPFPSDSAGVCAAVAYDQADSIVKRLQTAWQVTVPCSGFQAPGSDRWPQAVLPMGDPFVFATSSNQLGAAREAAVPVPTVGLTWVTPGGTLGLGAVTAFPEGLDPEAQQPNTTLAWEAAGLPQAMAEAGCTLPYALGVAVEPLQFDAPIGPGSPSISRRIWVAPRHCSVLFPLDPASGRVISEEAINVTLLAAAAMLGAEPVTVSRAGTAAPMVMISPPQLLQVNSTGAEPGADRLLMLALAPANTFAPTPRLQDAVLVLIRPPSDGAPARLLSSQPLCNSGSGGSLCQARVLALGQPAVPQSDAGVSYKGAAVVVPSWIRPDPGSNATEAVVSVLPLRR